LFGRSAINVTPQKLKENWINVHGKLATIKKNYDQSGNGAGNCHGDDPDHGPVSELTLANNTDGQNILGGNKPHLLYFWQILEDNNLLDSTLMTILNEISASCESVPGTVTFTTPPQKRTKNNEE
jgi:hypothetical protein